MRIDRKFGQIQILILLVLVQFFLAGCQSLTGETAGENIDDSVLTTEIKTRLAQEKLINSTRVGVKTERGVVYLTGAVPTPEERNRVVQITKSVRGVREVVNGLEIGS
ncbi:MAG TPA: BON domain-containing protein [Nitrospirales bacterium]|jgi:osmotically-inducible protein OsmY|nr:BON domain-containing protein [Nitrospirales bacterium]